MIRAVVGLTVAVVLGFGALSTAIMATPVDVTGSFIQPVHGAHISQPFGCTDYTSEPIRSDCPGHHWHSGVDLAVASGTPVAATLGGVATVINDRTGYGLHVVVDHGQSLSSLYAHLQAVLVVTGEVVVAGTLIGAVGSTGNSSGPHLHFEIRRDGIPEDPLLDLSLP